ncbi:unnamed protein product [Sphagnum compactum]
MDDDDVMEEDQEQEDGELWTMGESFWCSLCDDGGNLLFCDGPCLRSFHACLSEEEKAEGKACITLGFTAQQFEVIQNNMSTWFCRNCEVNCQQCFICGRLGRSDTSLGSKREVFNCDVGYCGRFYHPVCVSKWVTSNPSKQKMVVESIQQGVDTFLCPAHKCRACKSLEAVKDVGHQQQFAKCRRCPSSWHVECVPSSMPFEADIDEEGETQQRAWHVPVGDDNSQQFRVGVYCTRHDLPLEPAVMVKFPPLPVSLVKNAEQRTLSQDLDLEKLVVPKKVGNLAPGLPPIQAKSLSPRKGIYGVVDKQSKTSLPRKDYSVKQRAAPNLAVVADKSADKLQDIEIRMKAIIQESKSEVTAETVKQQLSMPSIYGCNNHRDGKFIHEGDLQSIMKSVQKALACTNLHGRDSLIHAQCLCPEGSLKKLERVQNQLKVYLAPFLHGHRYTSFGRHFTKTEKLREVVTRLQWYVQDGDMVVDFCCGANDFSTQAYQELSKFGKNCEFMNFDIHPPKNDFCFHKRDWMSVRSRELPSGNRLIIGLNPPFGVHAAIANVFVQHAATFRPKLIVLIVPPETKRPDGYELIWEDVGLLEGDAFYLPGSVSLEGKALGQWNNKAPPLYVWSRSDWVQKHREIALQKGHIKLLHTPMLQQHIALNISTRQPSFQQMEHTYSTVQTLQNVDIERAAMPSSVQLPFQNVNGFSGNMPGISNMEQPFLTPTPFHHHSKNPPGGFQHMQKNNHHQTIQLKHR